MKFHLFGQQDTISLAMYEDLAEELKKENELVFGFANVIGECSRAESICRERGFKTALTGVNPSLMMVTDFRCFTREDHVKATINIGHGIASKGDYFTEKTEYTTDYWFIYSDWLKDKLQGHSRTKFITTGMPKLDRAFKAREKWKMPEKPTVLIAPTWNPCYNCLEIISENIKGLEGEFNVIVKPHGFFEKSVVLSKWNHFIKNKLPDWVQVRFDYNITDLFIEADIIVSDVSSAHLEFMGLDKPIVVCESEYMKKRKIERPDAHEYFFREGVSCVIESGSELLEALREAKKDIHNKKRKEFSEMLFGYKGNSIERTLEVLKQI